MKIVASSDLHLGMKFSAYPEASDELIAARFGALERIVSTANGLEAELLVIAGDLFDRPAVPAATIERCVSLLAGFDGAAIAVLPGNHDYYNGAESAPWETFEARCRDAKRDVLVMHESRLYDLSVFDLNGYVLPGPCSAKHRSDHAIGWIDGSTDIGFELTADAQESPVVIGVAHGSVEGISPDLQGLYYPMRISDFQRTPAHLWIVGHTHAQARVQTRPGQELFIPGTPEPDGFDCRHSGAFWYIETTNGRITRADSYQSGTFQFVDRQFSVHSIDDLDTIAGEIAPNGATNTASATASITASTSASTAAANTLVRITLDGTLSSDAFARYRERRSRWDEDFFYFRSDETALAEELTRQAIDARYPEGSFPHRLLYSLLDEDDREAAQTALRFLEGAGEIRR